MKPPPLAELFPLDGDQISGYLLRKSPRLLNGLVAYREHLSTTTVRWLWVRGDHGGYLCAVLPTRDPWMGWCPRGGVHELTRPGEPCSHPLAAAARWAQLAGFWRDPYVGAGADGCRRSAQIDREESYTLTLRDPRVAELLDSAQRGEIQAGWLETAGVRS